MDSVLGTEILTTEDFRYHYHKAKNKRYRPVVVFVHHMWGNYKTTARHIKLLNEKGFDCVSFNLLMGSNRPQFLNHSDVKYIYKGVFYIWTRQIRSVLNHLSGEKIVYAFSGPSLSAFWACDGRSDVVKLICDGGPFHNIYSNTRNFFYHELSIKYSPLNKVAAFAGTSIWGFKPLEKLHDVLSYWKKSVPILSIRGIDDHIVSIDSIREVFDSHDNLNIEVLEIPHGTHLDGLRDFPAQYKKVMLPFIKDGLNEV